MTAQPEQHVRLKDRGKSGGIEEIDPALIAHPAFLPRRTDGGFDPALVVKGGLDERHAEGAALCTQSGLELLWIELVEHEVNAGGGAPLQRRQHGWQLMPEQRNHDEVVGDGLIQCVGNLYGSALTVDVDDGSVSL